MRWMVTPLLIWVLVVPALAHDESHHGHHHEPHHWESAEMRHELLTQTAIIGMAGIIAGGYRLVRRRSSV